MTTKITLTPGVFLSDKDLASIFGVSRSQIWVMARRGEICSPVKLSVSTSRWWSDSIIEKLKCKINGEELPNVC